VVAGIEVEGPCNETAPSYDACEVVYEVGGPTSKAILSPTVALGKADVIPPDA
jgi:hypothetical protein